MSYSMPSEDQIILDISHLDSNDTTGDIRKDASKTALLTTQLLVAIPIGTICFLLFCFLRARWNVMYSPRSRLNRLAPKPLPNTFFGWIMPLLRIPQSEVLDSVGLDATVLLAFFKMSYKLFAFCGFFALVILSPIKVYNFIPGMGKVDDNNALDDGPFEPTDPNDPNYPHESSEILISYVVFTWVFSCATYYFAFYNYREFSEVRHKYYLKGMDTVTARSVMVTIVPKDLQADHKLEDFYASLDLGQVENATVYRQVRKLRHAIEKRAQYLRKLEAAYVEYLGNPCDDPNYDPKKATKTFEEALNNDPSTANAVTAEVLKGVKAKRPTIRSGFLGLFGKKIDKIEYYTDQFIYYDQLVRRGRNGAYVSTSTGFVTFKDITSAQLAAQVLLHPEPFQCSTELAPEPRDVFWQKLSIRKRELIIRDVLVNCLVTIIVFSWTVPSSAVATLLSLNSLKKIFPWLEKLAESNEILKSFIQGTLPTLAVVTLNAIIPQVMQFLSKIQGLKSRSAIESSTFSKYFFFLLITVFLIFTVVGTWLSAIEDIAQNPTKITITLAKNLPRVAPFFINYVVLQGIALYPSRILMIKDIAMACLLRVVVANTPRDFAESSTPQLIYYGQELPPTVFIFVLVLVYSSIMPIILLFGTIYFFFGYICFKYLLLFVYFHPYESAGNSWPKIFRGITIGLYIFQLLMIGYMSLRKSFYLSASLVPLLVITAIYYYYVKQAYDRSSEFVPLSVLRENQKKSPTNTSDVNIRQTSQKSTVTNDTFGEPTADTSSTNNESNKKAQGQSQRDLLDDDFYQAAPDLYTNYTQPPMTLYDGILNTGMRDYAPPELKGSLPWLWLPVKRTKQEIKNGGFIRKLLGMNEITSRPISSSQSESVTGSTTDSNKKVAAVKTLQFVEDGSSSSSSGQSTNYGAVDTSVPVSEQEVVGPEQVVVSNEEQSTSSKKLSKAQKRRSMADMLGELAGSNFS
ncbi:unnamed protein product [Rhizophagus irregularis]|uniref:DUF221-domain-containing protein n=1 Tax=Rhizophagus irregularis TaxID=588596 RepID=A0A2N1P354_9GLOM|nr:DUF221-domain-containing protein [Rhizophagus irregularis]CAB4377235.1 unnamed protein product [Rhizophagus irregularis]